MKPYFIKLVKAGDRLRKFKLRKFSDPANFIYVDVSDGRGSRHIFKMLRSEKNGRSRWIYEVEGKLNEAIQAE